MYGQSYGLQQTLSLGAQVSPYHSVVSNYDSYSSIPFPFVSCACDPEYEVIWCATQNGFLRGYDAKTLQNYCSVEVVKNQCICHLQSIQNFEVTVTEYGMNLYNYGGLLRGTIGYEMPESGSYRNGYAFYDSGSILLSLVGDFDGIYTIDILSGKKRKRSIQDKGSCIYSCSAGSIIGTSTGSVLLLDQRMNKCFSSFNAYSIATQSAIQLNNYIITIGVDYLSKIQSATPTSTVKIFDLRTSEVLPYTHRFLTNPCSINITDEANDEFMICNVMGECCNYSLAKGLIEKEQFNLNNMDSEFITSAAVSSSGDTVVAASILGGIHVSANKPNWTINKISKIYPKPVTHPSVHVSLETMKIGLLQPSNLASYSATDIANEDMKRSSSIDSFSNSLLDIPRSRHTFNSSLFEVNSQPGIQHIIKPKKRIVPNTAYYGQQKWFFVNVDPRKQIKPWQGHEDHNNHDDDNIIPSELRYNEMKLNHFGFYDIDYTEFNSTYLVGLENNIANSFLNAIVTMLWCLKPLKNIVMKHVCSKEFCVCCELKFLFRMFDQGLNTKKEGLVVHATNFYRMLAHHPDSIAFGILDDNNSIPSLRAERFIRFVFNNVLNELKTSSSSLYQTLVDQMMMNTRITSKCTESHITSKINSSMVLNLTWPSSSSSFISTLQHSLTGTNTSTSWCDSCRKENTLVTTKQVQSLPQYLVCFVGQQNEDIEKNWRKNSTYFSSQFVIVQDKNMISVKEQEIETDKKVSHYHIASVLSLVDDTLGTKSTSPTPSSSSSSHHLVLYSLINQEPYDHNWFVFNDITISPSSLENSLSFTALWKSPICLIYCNSDNQADIDTSSQITPVLTSINSFYTSVSLGASNIPLSYHPLSLDALPGKGDLIAIDCEFIALNCEEAEIMPDGHRIVRKEADLRLGRVTVLTQNLEVFIDDYILCEEPVADYLTRFSGLTRDDLEFNKSQHHLVPLKDAYSRLRTLVDRGCIFVGHGLSKDFHTINIFVPPDQIIDTVDIYYFPRNRKLSLKYLAKVVLNETIQEGNHDSNEDARTALELYYKYIELKKEDKWEDMLKHVYEIGKQCNYYGYIGTSPPPPTD